MTKYDNHPATITIKNWIADNNITYCTVNEIWQHALMRSTDLIKDENRATLRDVHACCKAAGLIKKTIREKESGRSKRVVAIPKYLTSNV